MSRQSVKPRDVELIGEDIVGLFLSTEQHDVNGGNTDDEPRLRRFIQDLG